MDNDYSHKSTLGSICLKLPDSSEEEKKMYTWGPWVTLLTRKTFPSNKKAAVKDIIFQAGWFKVAIISPWIGDDLLFVQTWIPFTKEFFLQSLVEIGLVFLEKSSMYFHYFTINNLPLEKCPVQVWLNWPSGSGKTNENVKRLQTDSRWTIGNQKS